MMVFAMACSLTRTPYGAITLTSRKGNKRGLFIRAPGLEKSIHRLTIPEIGGELQFTNTEQELPIGELSARYTRRSEVRGDPSYAWETIDGGLDGVAIDLPAFDLKPTDGAYIPFNVRIHD